MSKTTKAYPAPVSHVAKEVKAGGHILLWVVLGIAVIAIAGPSLGSHAANAAVKGVVDTAKNTATGVCADDGLNHLCALPANSERMSAPPPTSVATAPPKPQPYGAPNGPIKPLPSVTPAAPKPQIGPAPDEPVLSGPPPGGILGELPGVGPVINELGPALKALNP